VNPTNLDHAEGIPVASEQAKEFRKQGIAAAKAGQKDQARQLLQQSLRLEPGSEVGWLWLASVARDQRERLFCLNKLLEVNPNNEMALQSLQSLGISREQLAQQMGASTPQPQSRAAAPPQPAPPPPGVPVADQQKLTELQSDIDTVVRDYLAPLEGYPDVKWVKKTRGRAGDRDALVLRAYIGGGVLGILIVVLVIGWTIVWNTPELRGIVFAPTPLPTRTPLPPSATYTPTAGATPTASPTPKLTLTPSPTVPPQIPNGAVSPPKATDIYPPVSERGIRDSIGLMDHGDLDVALPTLVEEVTLVASSFDPAPYYYQALVLARQNDLGGARQIMEAAERRLPEKPNEPIYAALVNAGLAYVDFLDAQQAVADGQRDQLSSIIANIKDHAEAAIAKDPRIAIAYESLAGGYRLNGDFDLAIGVLDDGLKVSELAANTNLIVLKAEIYFDQKEYDLADYQAFLALYADPNTEEAHLLQINSALAQKNPGLAVLRAQAYLFYFPGSAQGFKLLGDARLMENKPDLALESYSQALAGGDNFDLLVARAALYNDQHRYELARADLTTALTLKDDPEVRAQRMLAAYSAGNLATADSDAAELLGQGVLPDPQIKLLQARILVDGATDAQGDYEKASSLLSEAIAGSLPGDLLPVANEYKARVDYHLKKYPDALKAVEASLAAVETGSGHYWRGLILEAQGQKDEALREYDWVLSLGQIYPYSFLPDVQEHVAGLS
jgi:tetratricopeptide (TPR) repeat protein